MTQATQNWSKPARGRHAHVSGALAERLESATKAAIALANYLFRNCIDGKIEEIELYELEIGHARRSGKPYAKNTLREALKELVNLNLVTIVRNLRGGIFKLTISHPGGKIPFIRKPTNKSVYRQYNQKTDETQPQTIDNSFPITEEYIEKAEQEAKLEKLGQPSSSKLSAVVKRSLKQGCPNFLSPHSKAAAFKNDLPEEIKRKGDERDYGAEFINLEVQEICTVISDAMPLNPQVKTEALKYTLNQVTAAIALYQERKLTKPISSPQGWLTNCLRGQWWLNQDIPVTNAKKQINPPSPEQIEQLELLKRKCDIVAIMRQDWNDGWALVIDCGNGIVMPWWEVLVAPNA